MPSKSIYFTSIEVQINKLITFHYFKNSCKIRNIISSEKKLKCKLFQKYIYITFFLDFRNYSAACEMWKVNSFNWISSQIPLRAWLESSAHTQREKSKCVLQIKGKWCMKWKLPWIRYLSHRRHTFQSPTCTSNTTDTFFPYIHLCSKCGNGWMNKDETWFRQFSV